MEKNASLNLTISTCDEFADEDTQIIRDNIPLRGWFNSEGVKSCNLSVIHHFNNKLIILSLTCQPNTLR